MVAIIVILSTNISSSNQKSRVKVTQKAPNLRVKVLVVLNVIFVILVLIEEQDFFNNSELLRGKMFPSILTVKLTGITISLCNHCSNYSLLNLF